MGARRPQGVRVDVVGGEPIGTRPANRVSPRSPQSLAYQEDTGSATCFARVPATKLQSLMEAAPGQEPESSTEDDDGSEGGRATDALASLSERHREAFALHALAGLPFAEVARRLKISKTSAFRAFKEAHESLIKALENP